MASINANLPPVLRVPIAFGTVTSGLGASLLQNFIPSSPGAASQLVNAPLGAAGVCAVVPLVQALNGGAGKYAIVLQSQYQQLAGSSVQWNNSVSKGIAAPVLTTPTDLTNLLAVQLVNSTGSVTAAVQPKVTNTAANYAVPISAQPATLTDSNGIVWPIVSNTATVITLAFTAPGAPVPTTPGTGAFTVQTVAAPLVTILSDTPSSTTASAYGIMTDAGSPAWLVNQFVGQVLVDHLGQQFPILSNTAGVIKVLPNAGNQTLSGTSATYQVIQAPASPTNSPVPLRIVTGNKQVADTTDGTGTTNTFTPHAHVNWVANMFAGMILKDSANVSWLITSNTTTACTVASTPVAGVPAVAATPSGPVAGGLWTIATPMGASSVEVVFNGLGGSVSGTVSSGLTAAAQAISGLSISMTGFSSATALVTTGSGTLSSTGSVVSASSYTAGATANALAGMWLSDGTNDFLIISNTTLTTSANTGTITVLGAPASTPSTVLVRAQDPALAGALASSAVTGTPVGLSVSSTPSPTSPASGEAAVVSLQLI